MVPSCIHLFRPFTAGDWHSVPLRVLAKHRGAFASRSIKLVLATIAAIAILDTIGINITTGIAALGIGGLALALGAQKTIENLVGSVTVAADRTASPLA